MEVHTQLMTRQQASIEADRCLQCFDAPCMEMCPTHINIPTFIQMIRSGNTRGAAEVVKISNAMANVCGKVCPEEIYCQSVCNRAKEDAPVKIRELHFFATQYEARQGFSKVNSIPLSGKKVAVVGAGPAGLGCAFELSKLGHNVTVFDKFGAGGVPKKSIPTFRLPDGIIQDDMSFLGNHVGIKKLSITGQKFAELKKKYDAVYLGVGLGKDRAVRIKGEDLNGVFPVLEFLENLKSRRKKIAVGKRVVVIGGGNVSLDAASAAKGLGASEVILIYRRGGNEMKVWKSELEEARARGVEIRFLTSPVEILGKNRVTGIKCRQNILSKKKDDSGRPIPVEVKGSDFVIDADSIIIAVGQVIETPIVMGFKRNSKGYLDVDKKYQTSQKGIFAGGDAISGEGTIVQSVAHGKEAAWAIHEYLQHSKGKRTTAK
jgi:NADPH-dependent glutamate synthase beta subunit-like oxidoreductase